MQSTFPASQEAFAALIYYTAVTPKAQMLWSRVMLLAVFFKDRDYMYTPYIISAVLIFPKTRIYWSLQQCMGGWSGDLSYLSPVHRCACMSVAISHARTAHAGPQSTLASTLTDEVTAIARYMQPWAQSYINNGQVSAIVSCV